VYGVFSTTTFLWGDLPEQQQVLIIQKKPDAMEKATKSQTTASILVPSSDLIFRGSSAVEKTVTRVP